MRQLRRIVLLGFAVAALAAPAAGAQVTLSPNMLDVAAVPRSSAATQSDFAFKGNLLISGNYNGFRILDISSPATLRLKAL